ncbi:MAG: 4Fe-4S dicluster domain-containing protein [bacterium JZ-2024 1]
MRRRTEGIDGVARSALAFRTGTWRRGASPVFGGTRCSDCRLCMYYCPDGAVERLDKGIYRANLEYCKGCGICAAECPAGHIRMEEVVVA